MEIRKFKQPNRSGFHDTSRFRAARRRAIVSRMVAKRPKSERKPKLTDAERHKRFLDMARQVEASDNPKDFDKAFDKVASPKAPRAPSSGSRGSEKS